MSTVTIKLSDFVRVRNTEITGQVMEITGNKAVIIDDSSEYEYPESLLEFKLSDVELI